MDLNEKISYIKGLMEGMKLDETKDEVKVLKAMADLLDDMALTISDLDNSIDEAAEVIDVLDEDLGAVEEILYGKDACNCHCHDDDDCFEDEDIYEVVCPTCGESVCLTEEMLDEGQISCPNCGETLEFDFMGDFDDISEEEK